MAAGVAVDPQRGIFVLAIIGLMVCVAVPAFAQDEAVILIAHPAFRDLEYRQTVLIAAPDPLHEELALACLAMSMTAEAAAHGLGLALVPRSTPSFSKQLMPLAPEPRMWLARPSPN